MDAPGFDVFLSYSSADRPVVERIADWLREQGVKAWWDRWSLTGAGLWQEELVEGLRASACCAVFVGPAGLGDWTRLEVAVALDLVAKDQGFRLFMVLLPGAPDMSSEPTFALLSRRTWVDLREGMSDSGLRALLAAVTGPQRAPTVVPAKTSLHGRGLEAFDDETGPRSRHIPIPRLLVLGSTLDYVGRDELLARLNEARRQALDGACRAVLLAGEPGVGKTRTAAELAKTAVGEGAIVLYGRCDEDVRVPYQPFVEALDWYTTYAAAPILGRHPAELTRLQPLLASRVAGLGAPVSSDPSSQEYLLFEATSSWLVELARRQPLVLIVDDLHWASKPVLLLLRHVLRAAAAEPEGVPIFVLGTYRDTDVDRDHPLVETIADLRRLAVMNRLEVTGLSLSEAEVFVSRALGQDLEDDTRRLAKTLNVESDGNPFFIDEVLRHLLDTAAVQHCGERWVVTTRGTVAVPPGVRDVVVQRLRRLSADANEVLTIAAVIGRDFDTELLVEAIDLSEERLLNALDEALNARLIQETGTDRYRFAHALVGTTLSEDLSNNRRRRAHRRVAEVLENLRPNDVVRLAYHFTQAGPGSDGWSRAVPYCLAAANQALEARAPADAEAGFRQVLTMLGEAAADRSQRITALCGLGEAQRDQGNPEFRDTLLDAARLAQEAGDSASLVRAALSNSRGVPSIIGGVDADRVAITEAALELVGRTPSAERARLLAQLAAEITFTPAHGRRLALVDEAEDMARSLGEPQLLAWVLNRTGYAAFSAGRVEHLVARGKEATELSDATGDPTQRVLSRFFWSAALATAGDLPSFRAVTKSMVAVSQEAAPTMRWLAKLSQARLCLLDGDILGAQQINDDAFQLAQELGEPDGPANWMAVMTVLEYHRGGVGSLVDVLRAGSEQYPNEAAWRLSYAAALAGSGRVTEARAVFEPDPACAERLLDHPLPFFALKMTALLAFHLHDAELAGATAAVLRRYGDYWTHHYAAVMGPLSLALAVCAAVTGDLDESVALCEATEGALVKFGCEGLLPMFRSDYVRILLRRGSERDRRLAGDLLDQVRQGADDLDAPLLALGAADLTAQIAAERKT